MRFDSYFAGYNAYPYLSLYSGMVVFFADTGIMCWEGGASSSNIPLHPIA